jgi:Tol biopolymer transport system component
MKSRTIYLVYVFFTIASLAGCATPATPTFLPADGTSLPYASKPGPCPTVSVWVANEDGTDKVKITIHNELVSRFFSDIPVCPIWLTWEPQHVKRIAFTNFNQEKQSCHISVYNLGGSGWKNITSGPNDLLPDWAEDGTIFFIRRERKCLDSTGDVFSVQPDGSGLTQITKFGHVGGVGISHDGKNIAYQDLEKHQIMIYPLDGSESPKPIYNVDINTYYINPRWSEDGSELYLDYLDGSGGIDIPIY